MFHSIAPPNITAVNSNYTAVVGSPNFVNQLMHAQNVQNVASYVCKYMQDACANLRMLLQMQECGNYSFSEDGTYVAKHHEEFL